MVLHDNTWLTWDLVLCFADYGESGLLKTGVTLKARQDERTVASFWERRYPFSFKSMVCFSVSGWERRRCAVLLVCFFPMTKAPSEHVVTVFDVYSTLRRGEAKTVRVYCAMVVNLFLSSDSEPFQYSKFSPTPRKRDTVLIWAR